MNRLTLSIEDDFSRIIAGYSAIVRLLGPRRTGKTELVRALAQQIKVPLIEVLLPTLPTGAHAADLVVLLVKQAIAKLEESAPSFKREYDRVCADIPEPASDVPAVVAIGAILWLLETAATAANLRPIVLFDHAEKLVGGSNRVPDLCTAWAIRNQVQRHHACRYVLAGSNPPLFRMLYAGQEAPFLSSGLTVEVPLLTTSELNNWAIPLFEKSGRSVVSLARTNELVAGKIGEVVDVLHWLWSTSGPGDLLDESRQLSAVLAVARESRSNHVGEQKLTRSQSILLGWILKHPGQPPLSKAATAAHQLTPTTAAANLASLEKSGIIEIVGDGYVPISPLRAAQSK